jgi:Concanavalin A-like lectin/glucanases superfamily
MSLPSSGAISMSQVDTELGLSSTAQISLNDTAVRTLFGIASGQIDLNTGHGKTAYVTSGLIMNIDFNNASYSGTGSTVTDLTTNGNNGTLVNSPTYTSGTPSYMTFNGTSNYIGNAGTLNNFNFASTGGITVEAWVKPNLTSYEFWFSSNVTSGDCTYRFGTNSSGYYYWNMGHHVDVNTGGPISSNTWYQVVFTGAVVSGNVYTNVYLNGSNVVSNYNESLGSLSNPTNWLIGHGETSSAWPYNGNVSIIRVYNTALNSTQVTQNYNASKATFGLS